jgi:hypothetical protein
MILKRLSHVRRHRRSRNKKMQRRKYELRKGRAKLLANGIDPRRLIPFFFDQSKGPEITDGPMRFAADVLSQFGETFTVQLPELSPFSSGSFVMNYLDPSGTYHTITKVERSTTMYGRGTKIVADLGKKFSWLDLLLLSRTPRGWAICNVSKCDQIHREIVIGPPSVPFTMMYQIHIKDSMRGPGPISSDSDSSVGSSLSDELAVRTANPLRYWTEWAKVRGSPHTEYEWGYPSYSTTDPVAIDTRSYP